MTKHSDEGYLVHIKADENLDGDDPLSIDVVRALRNNLLHLHDMSTEYYCNQVSHVSLDPGFTKANTDWELICSVPIRVIPRQDGAPADLIVRVTAQLHNATTGSLETIIVPFGAPFVQNPSPRYANTLAGMSVTAATIINAQYTFAKGSEAHKQLFVSEQNGGALTSFPSYANSAGTDPATARFPMWRCDLWGIGNPAGSPPLYKVWDFSVRSFIGS